MSDPESDTHKEVVRCDGFIELHLFEPEYLQEEYLQNQVERRKVRTTADTTFPVY